MIEAGVARAAQIIDVYELADYRADFLESDTALRDLDELVQSIANQPGTRVYREAVGEWPVRLTIVRDRLVPDISSMGHERPVPPRASPFDGIRLNYPNMRAAARAYMGTGSIHFPTFRPFNPGPIN